MTAEKPNVLERAYQAGTGLDLSAATKTIYGCSELFPLEAEDALLSLSFGPEPFLDWIGWTPTNICVVKKYFMAWVRADKAINLEFTEGWLADACADPHSFEWDTCDFTLHDFARLRRMGPVRDLTKTDIQYTWNQPRYRLDGSLIGNDREFDARLAMEVLLQDLRRMVIEGNSATPGQFDGLEQLVKYNYTNSDGACCRMMDSIVIDWNDLGLAGGDGATWNGIAITEDTELINVLIAVFRKIKRRIKMAPILASQKINVGDIALVLPEDFTTCILDAFTCWSVCGDDWSIMDNYEARTFRQGLMGGKFGAGRIFIDGFEIPLLPFDYGLINGGNTFDMYFLTSQIGNVKVLYGEYNNLAIAAKTQPARFSTDGGKFLFWEDLTHTCERRYLEMQPRMVMWAPWAQARIMDVSCDVHGGVISADPTDEYFLYKDDDPCTGGHYDPQT